MKTDSKIIMKSMVWKSFEKIVVQSTRLIMEIVMARLLLPSEFGVFTLLMTFTALSNIMIESGLGTALIQTKEEDERDSSTVLYIFFIMTLLIYLVLFLAAPAIEVFYNIDGFACYLKAMALVLVPSAYNSVQNSIAMRNMKFRAIFRSNSVAILISGVIAIVLATNGFGIWALVIQYAVQITISCILMNFFISWKPKRVFSVERGKKLLAFGWKLMLANFLNRGYAEVYNIIIGKAFNITILGFYNRAKLFPGALENGMSSVVTTVMMPVFSRMQENKEELKKNLQLYIEWISFIITPLFFGIAATSDAIVTILLTEKWIEVAPIMQILSIGFVFQPISHINTTAINGLGRSDIILKLEIIKRSIGIALLLVAVPFGIKAVALGLSLSYFINMIINCNQNKKLLGWSLKDLFSSILPSVFIALFMFGAVRVFVIYVNINSIALDLIIQIAIGICIYVGLSCLFNKKPLKSSIRAIKKLLKR